MTTTTPQTGLMVQALKRALRARNRFTDIAHDAGFTDSSHFHRTFIQLVGSPPSQAFKNRPLRIHVRH